MSVLLCLCSCPDDASAARIADALVDERLAACVSIVPGMRSVYRWQGKVQRSDEMLLLVKTSAACADTLRQRIVALHPHEVPEVVMIETDGGLPAYLDWVAAETTPANTADSDAD